MSEESQTSSATPVEGQQQNQNPTPATDNGIARAADGTLTDVREAAPVAGTESPAAKPEGSVLNEGEKPAAVPEKYEFKLPEGATMSPESQAEVGAMFKELGLTQDAAQKLVDYQLTAQKAAEDRAIQSVLDTRAKWAGEAKAALGANAQNVRADIAKMYDMVGDPALVKDFREAMDFTGVGDHPAFVRLFAKLAENFREGKGVTAGGPSPLGQNRPGAATRPTLAQSMFPNNVQQ